jgi:uncharacterized membrane protein
VNQTEQEDVDEPARLGFWQLAKSILAAFIGVQSNANRERDFRQGKISHFVIMGLVFGAVFVLTIIGVVQLVMHFAG